MRLLNAKSFYSSQLSPTPETFGDHRENLSLDRLLVLIATALRELGCFRLAGMRWSTPAVAITVLLALSSLIHAQQASTGSIAGTITGPRGASVSGADVTITNKLTGQTTRTTTSPAGTYAVRDLPPGDYVVHVDAKGYRSAELLVRIQAASNAAGDLRLQRAEAAVT